MKVRFVFMTRATGLMVHLLPDVMYIEPSDNSRAIVIGVLNMHLSFKFQRKKKRENLEMDFRFKEPIKAMQDLRKALTMKGGEA